MAVVARTHGPVVPGGHFSEGFGTPPHHPRANHGNIIYPAAFQRNVASDSLETLSPEQLAGSGNMFSAAKPVIVGKSFFSEWCSRQTKARIADEFVKQETQKYSLIKREVRIQATDYVVSETSQAGAPSVNATDLATKMTPISGSGILTKSIQLYSRAYC